MTYCGECDLADGLCPRHAQQRRAELYTAIAALPGWYTRERHTGRRYPVVVALRADGTVVTLTADSAGEWAEIPGEESLEEYGSYQQL